MSQMGHVRRQVQGPTYAMVRKRKNGRRRDVPSRDIAGQPRARARRRKADMPD
jgi:hypothetical protein